MIYRPTVLPREQCAGWWRDDRAARTGATQTHIGLNEVECRLCLQEIQDKEPDAPASVWSSSARIPLKTLWPALLVHLLQVHGVVLDDRTCPE